MSVFSLMTAPLRLGQRVADDALLRAYNFVLFDAPGPLRKLQSRVSYDTLSIGLSATLPGGLTAPALDELTAGSGFLNYGYGDEHQPEFEAALPEALRARSHSIRLYEHVLEGVPPAGQELLEVGCGRGGGCHYIKDRLDAASVVGVDLSPRAVAFCTYAYGREGLRYVEGDAQDLPFEDGSFDIVVNVESSHCYGSMPAFLAHVRRVLRPGGVFAWADARPRDRLAETFRSLLGSGLEPIRDVDISAHVLESLEATSDEKIAVVDERVPLPLRPFAKSGMAVRGTLVYEALARGELVYHSMQLRKGEA
jgi:SAM-dependent methyltransferase